MVVFNTPPGVRMNPSKSKELRARKEAVDVLRRKIKQGTVTLVYAAHDEKHNGAVALKAFLENQKGCVIS
jgi:uncharacterized protein YeaO (DUF488 family)